MTTDQPSALGVARLRTVAFSGIEVKDVDVQIQISAGPPAFTIVGLPDKGGRRIARAGAKRARRSITGSERSWPKQR
jgi:magnesium chelatase family protein